MTDATPDLTVDTDGHEWFVAYTTEGCPRVLEDGFTSPDAASAWRASYLHNEDKDGVWSVQFCNSLGVMHDVLSETELTEDRALAIGIQIATALQRSGQFPC